MASPPPVGSVVGHARCCRNKPSLLEGACHIASRCAAFASPAVVALGLPCITALAEEALRAISGDRGTHVKAPRQGLASSKSCGRTSRTSTMRQPCCAVSRGRSTWNAWWTSAPRSKAQEVRMQLGCVGIKRMGLGRKRRVGPRAGPRGSCRVGGPAVVLRAESAPVREGQCAGCHMPNPDCHDQMQQWRPA